MSNSNGALAAALTCLLLAGCSHHVKPDNQQSRNSVALHRGQRCQADKDCRKNLVCRDDPDTCTPSVCGDGPGAYCTSDCNGEVCMEPEGWFFW
jgi:hypothetical protein